MEQALPKPSLKERLKALLDEYGKIAMFTYLTIWILVIGAFAVAIQLGIKVEGTVEPGSGWGLWATLGAGWLAAKVTQPLRILATLVLTPIIGKIVQKLKKRPPPPAISG